MTAKRRKGWERKGELLGGSRVHFLGQGYWPKRGGEGEEGKRAGRYCRGLLFHGSRAIIGVDPHEYPWAGENEEKDGEKRGFFRRTRGPTP